MLTQEKKAQFYLQSFQKQVPELVKQEADASLLGVGSIIYGIFNPIINKYYKNVDFKASLFLQSKQGQLFFSNQAYRKTTQEAFTRYLKNSDIFEKQSFEKLKTRVNSIYLQDEKKNISDFSIEKLGKKIEEVFKLMQEWVACTIYCESIDQEMIKELYNKIKGKDFAYFENIIQITPFLSFKTRFNKYLLESSSKSPYRLQWLLANYHQAPKLEEVSDLINNTIVEQGGRKKISQEIKEKQKEVTTNKKIVNGYRKKLSKQEILLLDFINSSIELRELRRITIQKLITLASNYARVIFNKKGLLEEDIGYCNYLDFKDESYLQDDYQNKIKARKDKGVFMYVDNKKVEIIPYFDKQFKNKLLKHQDSNKELSLKGSKANPGYAKGKVQIILSVKDFNKFEEGNILVTSMTRPEFGPILKKAKAIITDEGGLTCHAAIISRELGIPCIVGTKKATSFLKDGNQVEINADEGIIELLNN